MATKLLLVEGSDDRHVIWNLLAHHQFPHVFSVDEKGGVDHLLKVLPVQLKASDMAVVGVVLDADLDLAGRWASLRVLVEKAGYKTCPANPNPLGTILKEDGLPTFGAWLMPNNLLPGMLEDFVAYLVPDDDVLWQLACDTVVGIPEGERRFILDHAAKAKIHTWLAWQQNPGTPMGLAITKKYLNGNDESVTPFLAWLQALFVDE